MADPTAPRDLSDDTPDTTPGHAPGVNDDEEQRKGAGLLKRAVTAVIGDPAGDKTEPGSARGWEQPLEEQQTEPENEPKSV